MTGASASQPGRKRRPRILFGTLGYPPDRNGGAEHQAAVQAEELHRRGRRVTVVCPSYAGLRSGAVNGVKVVRLANRRIPMIWAIRDYLRLRFGRGEPAAGERRTAAATAPNPDAEADDVRGFKASLAGLLLPREMWSYPLLLFLHLLWNLRRFDLVHVHMARSQVLPTCLAARLWRRPVYAKAASKNDVRFLRRTWLRRKLALPCISAIQAISDEIAAALLAAGFPATRIVRIPNGLQLSRWGRPTPAEKHALRERLNLPVDACIVLFLGRFAEIKGLDVLIQAWSGLDDSAAVLLLVGRKERDRREVRDLLRNAPEQVIIHDWTQQSQDYYAAADVFVLPSRGEGMSNALLEAMGSGLAVVATRVGAAEAMIVDGASGLLVDPSNVEQLRDAIARLLRDQGLRDRLGAAASEHVRSSYSIESVADQIEAVYAAIQDGRPLPYSLHTERPGGV